MGRPHRPHRPERADQRRFELSVLADVARALNASVDLPALLAQALEKVAELLGLDTGWVLLFDEATGERLPPAVEAGLYRIAEEALRNAVTHAGAKRVLVHFERTAETAVLVEEDVGRGIEPGAAGGEPRFGLVGMRERAKLLGGTLDVESDPGVGTRVTARIPT